ncbi:hypothetical protein DDP54_03815 [Cellulomonas sp. WB94]|nr:hypothetical protein DDP54_03815 [Cellulomonas sp. WB94]
MRSTFQVKKSTGFYPRPVVDAHGGSAVGQAGGVLLTRAVRASGLDVALSAELARWRKPSAVHDPAKVLANGTLLFTTFVAALGPLRGKASFLDAPTASAFLFLSFALLVVNPLYYATARANTDLVFRAIRVVRRFSSRRQRRAITSYRA